MSKENKQILWIIGIIVLLLIIINYNYKPEKVEEETGITVHFYGVDGKEIYVDGYGGYSLNKPIINQESKSKLDFSSLNNFIKSIINLIKGLTFNVESFTNQCSLPACDSGWTDYSTMCETSTNVCTRTCKQTIAAYCGSYGSEQYKTSIYTVKGANDRDVWKKSSSLTTSTSNCYSTSTYILMDNIDRGTANSYRLYSFLNGWSGTLPSPPTVYLTSPCKDATLSSGSFLVSTDTGRGTGNSIFTEGTFHDYGSSDCTGGTPLFDLDGTLRVELRYKIASWIPDSTSYKDKTCNYACDRDSECSADTWTGSPYCSGNDIYRNWIDYYCSSYSCQSSTSSRFVQTCANGCSDGVCKDCIDTSWNPDPSTICSGTSFTQTSNCGNTRISTGTKVCCTPESDIEFCSRLGKNCDSLTTSDNCGIPRTVNCGTCSGICADNVCAGSLSFTIKATATSIPYNGVSISASNPIDIKNALIDNTPINLAENSVKNWNTSNIAVQPAWVPSKTFTVDITGTNFYTNQVEIKTASTTINF